MKHNTKIIALISTTFFFIMFILTLTSIFNISGSGLNLINSWASYTHCTKTSNCFVYRNKENSKLYLNGSQIRFFGTDINTSGLSWNDKSTLTFTEKSINDSKNIGANLVVISGIFSNSKDFNSIQTNIVKAVDYAQSLNMYVAIDFSDYKDLLCSKGINAYEPTNWKSLIQTLVPAFQNKTNLLYYSILGNPNYVGENARQNCLLNSVKIKKLPDFYNIIASYIKQADKNHLVSTGGLEHIDNTKYQIDWQSIYSALNIDIVSVDITSLNEYNISMQNAITWSEGNKKPFIIQDLKLSQTNSTNIKAACPAFPQSDFVNVSLTDKCRSDEYTQILTNLNRLDENSSAILTLNSSAISQLSINVLKIQAAIFEFKN